MSGRSRPSQSPARALGVELRRRDPRSLRTGPRDDGSLGSREDPGVPSCTCPCHYVARLQWSPPSYQDKGYLLSPPTDTPSLDGPKPHPSVFSVDLGSVSLRTHGGRRARRDPCYSSVTSTSLRVRCSSKDELSPLGVDTVRLR